MKPSYFRTILTIVMLAFATSVTCSALDFSRGYWWALNENNVFLQLKEYGAYDFQSGQCLNRLVPSFQNNNPYEFIQVIKDGDGTRLLWGDTADGRCDSRMRIDDDTVYLTGRRPVSGGSWQPWDSWIRVVDWNGSRLFTVSKKGIYSVFDAFKQ